MGSGLQAPGPGLQASASRSTLYAPSAYRPPPASLAPDVEPQRAVAGCDLARALEALHTTRRAGTPCVLDDQHTVRGQPVADRAGEHGRVSIVRGIQKDEIEIGRVPQALRLATQIRANDGIAIDHGTPGQVLC